MPNKLQGMRTYLVGAMDRVPDGGVGWRNEITPKLKSLNIQNTIRRTKKLLFRSKRFMILPIDI